MDHHLHTVAVVPRRPGPHARGGLRAPWLWLDSSVNGGELYQRNLACVSISCLRSEPSRTN